MKLKQLALATVFALSIIGCKDKDSTTTKTYTAEEMKDNPLVQESTLPYFAPDFSKIKDEHYKPALEYALQVQMEAIDKIANNSEAPTFENTLVEMEKAGALLDQVASVFGALANADTNDHLKALDAEMSTVFAEQSDKIKLNEKLFERIKTLHDQKDQLGLEGEDLRLLEVTYQNFSIAGANLPKESKDKLKEINSKIAGLENKFGQTVMDASNAAAITVTDTTLLAGLTPAEMNALKVEGKNEWKIPVINTTQQPMMQTFTNQEMREKLFNASWKRTDGGEFSTLDIIKELVGLRIEKAKLLGFNNYAEWLLQDAMVETPKTVTDFYAQLVTPTVKAVDLENQALVDLAKADGLAEFKPSDWTFYAEKLRKAKYDLDESQIKPYFELKNVLEKGAFYAATKLYGITFKERKDIPTYHPDVMVYEIFEEDGTPLALFYGDFFKRESKRGGAWMGNFVTQSHLLNKKPVIYNVCNYAKPAAGEAALISFDDVTTLFHEFGHALHGLFANQKYPSLSGTSVARDFVELPSQAHENWILEPEVLKNYAIHYQTGEVIPQALIDKIKRAATFNQGFAFGEVLAASVMDFNFHTLNEIPADFDVNKFEMETLKGQSLWMTNVPPRYRASYFNHIFGGGYAASYYAYTWTEMLARDTGKWFQENGGLTRANGQRYRDLILSKGNTINYKEAYNEFRGGEPQVSTILIERGLQ
ncbi:M3 family metallopeptidase [Moheibacter stercoris]|uniref:Peptidyl-dipeptidase Dcp n=1 Tax=Moheibacter stercoris TaxID=1628251 RepID=A0ABV2LW89_9FLAO